ncbi:MAG: hypothetical protein HYX69_13460 [Planctomycetia bacterium]|nr:hypothetical protein [Planctomycetia bacterium]
MHDRQPPSPLFTQVDISAGTVSSAPLAEPTSNEQVRLLRDLVAAQDRQNELLEELVTQVTTAANQFGAAQRQRNQELAQWKEANPELARECRSAAESLCRVQTEFLNLLVSEVNANAEALADGEFMLTEFVDRFGPRLAHLNGVLQVLAQLSNAGGQTAERG